MRALVKIVRLAAATGALLVGANAGTAAAQPVNWQLSFQDAASPIMRMANEFHIGLLIVVTLIMVFVTILLGIVVVRFNAKVHPQPNKTSHNTIIEVLWTVLPIIILVGIAIPSFTLLFAQYDPARAIEGYDPVANPPLTIKVTGSQWAWAFDYEDEGISIFTTMKQDADLGEGDIRLLSVDNAVIVPVGQVVQLQITASDVIHAFAMPALGIKVDAVPGRLNETWFLAEREGVYYGQCSELCGQPNSPGFLTGHAFMPAEIRAVSAEQYAAWLELATSDLAGAYQRLAAMTAEQGGLTQVAGR